MRTFATFNLCILSLLLCFNMITSLRSNNVLRPQISSMGVCYGNHVSVYTSHRRESTTRQWVQRPRPPTTPDRRWEVRPIGRIESPYVEKFGAPKQATILENGGGQAEGSIILFPGYEECLTSLEGFDYIWVISYLHRNSGFKTKIRPQPVANSAASPPQEVGLFASRAPHRPNPIGMSALQVRFSF